MSGNFVIGFVGSAMLGGTYTPDDVYAAEALQHQGHTVILKSWDDPEEVWDDCDAYVNRSTWGYCASPELFSQWLSSMEEHHIPLFNSPRQMAWNIDKSYLLDLERRGLKVPPLKAYRRGTNPEMILQDIQNEGWDRCVIKPLVGSGAQKVIRTDLASLQENPWLIANRVQSYGIAVQTYMDIVHTDGEWSLIFFDGQFSHAVIKKPTSHDFRVQKSYGGSETLTSPPDLLLKQAHDAICALDECPLYARVDGFFEKESLLVNELEVIECELMFSHLPSSAHVFANALVKRIAAL